MCKEQKRKEIRKVKRGRERISSSFPHQVLSLVLSLVTTLNPNPPILEFLELLADSNMVSEQSICGCVADADLL